MNFLKNKFFLIFVLIVLPAQIVTALDIPDQKQLNQLLKSAQSKGSPVAIQASPLNQRSLPADKPFTKVLNE
jgi:hypothetical protein